MIKRILYSVVFSLFFCGNVSADYLIFESKEISELLNKAEALEKQSNFDGAIALYNKALSVASKNNLSTDLSFIYKKIGDIYYTQKQFQKAKSHFQKSVLHDSLDVYSGDVHLSLGLLYRKQNNKDSLLIHLKYALGIYGKKKSSKLKFSTYLKAFIIISSSKAETKKAINKV